MMVFENAKLASGEDWPNRWFSEDGEYAIHRYTYWNKYGRSCAPADKCAPYFKAYRVNDGKSLTDNPNDKVPSFEVAAGLCMDDAKRRGL